MNKFCLTICFCLSFLFFLSCERPDLSDELKGNWYSVNCGSTDGYTWSPKSSGEMSWDDAVSYCDNLTACGFSDWHLPAISELRTLIKNCSATETGGSCGVTDSCLSHSDCRNDACWGCDYDSSGGHSKLGDTDWFWSSSVLSDHSRYAWNVKFSSGLVDDDNKDNSHYVRCVR